jgi:DEAD/DEAH box helicase domain-containing protein
MPSVVDLASETGYRVIATGRLEGRAAKRVPPPPALHQRVVERLNATHGEGIYSHQAEALDAFVRGHDVCLSTSTASGKSLVFMSAAVHLLLNDDQAAVVALYPARALIQDQIRKWRAQLEPFGIGFGYIDGGVPTELRLEFLRKSRVILMTPDVAHAWLLSHVAEPTVRRFLESFKLLILDEAHVYEGVFGTNMAYLLRRLQVASALKQVICSTATLGKPADFLQQLTGREPATIGPEADGSASPQKDVAVLRYFGKDAFDAMVRLLRRLSSGGHGRFLAFADSRRMVEQIVAAVQRTNPEAEDDDEERTSGPETEVDKVLPYRAGYEDIDRKRIQEALQDGSLAGVVSTSALELGIDIGDLDVIVLLGPPPSVKAFRQRIGRAGRRRAATCLMLDDRSLVADSDERLAAYLKREPEPSWLYLENRYIQYANALCAALELTQGGRRERDPAPYKTLPPTFGLMLVNEIDPKEVVPNDLYVLKQRAQAGPHREFPIRSGIEKEFRVQAHDGQPLGTLTFSQALREAYPGAIYHYMARPFRAIRFDYRRGQITAVRARRWTTRPLSQTMVFPRFQGGALSVLRSENSFVAETELQVSERVLGFTERRGSAAPETHKYGPNSQHYQRPIDRFFQTTGVCWYFPNDQFCSDLIASLVLKAFCVECAVQERDLGFGRFHAQESPLGHTPVQGMCIYDAADGSLRLTQRLAEGFADVLGVAAGLARAETDGQALAELLDHFAYELQALEPSMTPSEGPTRTTESDWVVVLAPGSRAIYESEDGTTEVEVITYRYTPQGLLYELVPNDPGTRWLAKAASLRPIHGVSKMLQVNLVTGDSKPIE